MKLKPKEAGLNTFGVEMRNTLSAFVPLADEDWSLLWKRVKVRTYKKGEEIIGIGQVCDFVGFLAQGVCRVYYLEGEKEITSFFNYGTRNNFVSAFSSFLSRIPSQECIQALEETLLLSLDYSDLQYLYEKSSSIQKLGRLMAEQNYLLAIQRVHSFHHQSAEDRYEELLRIYPGLMNRVAQMHLASYLGISTEEFSRLIKSYFGRH
jgi:CRP-like cAMP-binding protein